MTAVAPTVAACLGVRAPAQAVGPVIEEMLATLGGAERLAVIAPDAVGLAIWRRWRERMPFVRGLVEGSGVALRAVMPTITPVNFATMVTGVGPEVHGVGAFSDDFQCETLFDVLREEGRGSAGCGQPGYTGGELLARFADVNGRVDENDDDLVTERVIQIARDERPAFIIAQLGRTDDVLHAHGPAAEETAEALARADGRLAATWEALGPLGYGMVVLADHGQHEVVWEDGKVHGSHGSDCDEDALVPCGWLGPRTRSAGC